ncbi:MAG: DNA polymerase I [Gammaproteobacteria bacterium]|nr:DNA polymerase I [Gammaproteobacteria bacterium]
MTKPIILVDGSSYFFRAFHALPPLMNSKKMPTGAVYGVANMMRRLIKDHAPEHLVVVFDTKGPTFRDELYPAYKAHRPPMPTDLSVQFEPLVTLLRLMGIPVLMIEGVEADDVIGTLAREAERSDRRVLISTGDKDFAQLVNENVTLLNTMSNVVLDVQGVKDKFEVWPNQMIDYLTLVGDSVDNVPGVPKCGPKTAVKWLQLYGTVDALLAHADDITGKIGESLRESAPRLPLTKQLVTIKVDVALQVHVLDYVLQSADTVGLLAHVSELEFKSWVKELLSAPSPSSPSPTSRGLSAGPSLDPADKPRDVGDSDKVDYTAIQDPAHWETYLKTLSQANCICLDTETTSLDPLEAQLVGISLATEVGHAIYIPLRHLEAAPQLSVEKVLSDLKPIFENPQKVKVGQNLKYDYSVLKQCGIVLQGMAFDTMLESYVLDSSLLRHNMDALALRYLNYQPMTYEKLTKREGKQLRFDEVPIIEATFYSAEDADVTLRLHQHLYPLLSEGQKSVLQQIEMPLVSVLADMELTGVLIDKDVLHAQGLVLKARIAQLEEEAHHLAGYAFNLQSPLQLQTLLFTELGLPVVEKTPKGQPSTAESALQALADMHRLPAVIVEHRRLSKLVSTYLDALPKRIHAQTGRVHTSFNQAVTATGRLSSSEPNLQNIPVRSEEGRAIRQAFIAPPGYCLLSADYSQIELRIMAHLSQDAGLLQAFSNNLDIHSATASELFGVPLAELNAEHRRCAKAVNFGLIYGMSAFGLAKQLGVDRKDAERYVKTYFERYPGVLAYMERTRALAYEQGYVETLLGRRLTLPDIRSANHMRRKAAERMAINAPMQGTAADLIKLAMIELGHWQKTEGAGKATLILQVHDELLFEVHESAVADVRQVVKDKMEHALALDVPLLVSIGVGSNWAEAHG